MKNSYTLRNAFFLSMMIIVTGLDSNAYSRNVYDLPLDTLTSAVIDIKVTCPANAGGDLDDMCIWLHPEDPALSTIIGSDKDLTKLFVYGLDGKEKYSYPLQYKPGNIDIIYNFPLNGELIDVVGFNARSISDPRFVFFKVDKQTGELDSLAALPTTDTWSEELYGFCLYRSPNNNEFYAFGCDYLSMIQQYRLFDDGSGNLIMEHKRTFQNGSGGPTEGMVADHETGLLYAGNENRGIYVYYADEDSTTDAIRFLHVERGILEGDVEGLAIYYAENGQGYLLASSQGKSYISVFKRSGVNSFVGKFSITGVDDTDGIDVLSCSLDSTFSNGIFACHNGRVDPCPINLIKWEDIAGDISPGLFIDTTYWDPRDARQSIDWQIHKDITVAQADSLIAANSANSNFNILDVRTLVEFSGGHIPYAINIDYNFPAFSMQLDSLDKNDIYLVYCKTGDRSSRAIDTMKLLGFYETYNILGGIDGWISAGYETVSNIKTFDDLSIKVEIYPNPTHDFVTLEFVNPDQCQIQVSSINGQQILCYDVRDSVYLLDLSNFQRGVYFITILSEGYRTTRKIVKL